MQRYVGAYTHDDIFYLEYNWAMTLKWYDIEKSEYDKRYLETKEKLKPKKK